MTQQYQSDRINASSTLITSDSQGQTMKSFNVSDYDKLFLFSTAIKSILNVDIVLNLSNDHDNTIELERIVVPSLMRNKGIGTKTMESLVFFTRAEGYSVELIPIGIGNNNDAATESRLRDFYSRFGFLDTHAGTMRLESKT